MDKLKSTILAHSPPAIDRLLRHRWAAAGVGSVALFGMMAAFALVPSGDDSRVQLQTVLEQLTTPENILIDSGRATFLREERVQRSDTVSSLILRLGITDQAALEFIRKSPEAQAISRQLRPGKVVTAKTGEHGELLALYFPLNG